MASKIPACNHHLSHYCERLKSGTPLLMPCKMGSSISERCRRVRAWQRRRKSGEPCLGEESGSVQPHHKEGGHPGGELAGELAPVDACTHLVPAPAAEQIKGDVLCQADAHHGSCDTLGRGCRQPVPAGAADTISRNFSFTVACYPFLCTIAPLHAQFSIYATNNEQQTA